MFGSKSDPAVRGALRRIEKKLDMLLERAGIEFTEEDHPEVRRLAQAGQKIEAIKLYRDQTGVGLAEAKAAVDEM